MTDHEELPEDKARRYAQQVGELESWKARYKEAAELWDALETTANQHVIGAVLVAKAKDFDTDITSISMANTDDVDWVDQVGILRAATIIVENAEIKSGDD